jgi:uncharacterized delta-60 repeat protein
MGTFTDRGLPMFEALENRQLLSAGQLDASFGDGGKVVTNLGLGGGNGVAVQADGRIVVSAYSDDRSHVNLVRYNADGSIDATFGSGGVVTANFDGNDVSDVDSMVVQADGKLVLAGRYTAGHVYGQLVARFNADGSLDTSFGKGGSITLAGFDETADPSLSGPVWTAGRAILATQVDGGIVLSVVRGGNATDALDLTVYRFTQAGQLDTTFGGGDGIASVNLGTVESPSDMAIQADGKIVVLADGYTIDRTGGGIEGIARSAYVIRLNADGSLDATFGRGGVVTENTRSEQIRSTKLAIGMDGKILMIGENVSFHTNRGTDDKFLIRYNSNGTRDTSFGSGGKVELTVKPDFTFADLLVQPDGKLLLTGGLAGGKNGNSGLFSQRRNGDGTLDATYGTGGTTRVAVGPSFDFGRASALQQDGRVVVVGFTAKNVSTQTHDSNDVVVARFDGDAGAAGSKHASLRRGRDQQAEYTGRPAGKHRHRSPKQRAREAAALAAANGKRHHRSPKRRAMDEAAAATAAAAQTGGMLTFTTTDSAGVFQGRRPIVA